ncbi:MAG: helix-turn-helix transcriptional regulator, partial [Ktedonobacterales bacterium]
MYYPTTRVLTVLELLQSRNRIGGAELAERLEVDVRTVRRYITMLQDLGIPVEGTRGRYGAYRLRPGFKLPPLMFSEDEALALVLGLLAARRLGLTLAAPATEGALAKVERVLPLALRERVRAVEETLVIEAGTRDVLPASGEIVVTLGTAAQQQRRIWLRYRAWEGEESERAMDPYGLVYRAGRWYVVGYCHLRDGVRVFRLDRVLSVELLADTFKRPPDLNLLEHVERGIASVPSDWHVEALLHTTL